MRCPECDVRNSVAARKCAECGKVLPRKKTPLPYIVGGIAVVGLAGAGLMGIGAAVTTKHDPQNDLASVAHRMGAGPKNPAEAEKMKADLDTAVKEYLKKAGAMTSAELASAMREALPTQVFEVHVLDLPRGLKIVEIDTMLQASNYLMMKNDKDVKVVNIPGLEVCDGAQVINDPTGPVLIAVGHSVGQGSHRPMVKVYSLMPDAIRDQSDKSVPPIKGDGNASFAKNNKDVNVEVSLYSIGVAEGAFAVLSTAAANADDETLKTTLTWDHGKFAGEIPGGRGQLAALHAVARSLKAGEVSGRSKNYLSSNAQKQMVEFKGSSQGDFMVSKIKGETGSRKRRVQKSNRFGLTSGTGASYIVELANSGGGKNNWVANSVTKTTDAKIAKAQMPGEAKPMTSTIVPAAVKNNLSATPSTEPATITTKRVDSSVSSTNGRTDVTEPSTPAPIVERHGDERIPVKGPDGKVRNPEAKIVERKKSDSPVSDAARINASNVAVSNVDQAKTEKAKATAAKIEAAKAEAARVEAAKAETAKAEAKKAEQLRAAEAEKQKKQSQQIASAVKTSPRGGVAVSRDPSIKDAPAVTPTPGFIGNNSDLQLRRGPSGGYRTVGRLSRGEQLEIIGKRDGWYKVRIGGREGFVPESSVKSSKPVGDVAQQQDSSPPRHEVSSRREASSSRETSSDRPSASERRREERRLARAARAAARAQKPAESAPTRSAPHADEPTNFVP